MQKTKHVYTKWGNSRGIVLRLYDKVTYTWPSHRVHSYYLTAIVSISNDDVETRLGYVLRQKCSSNASACCWTHSRPTVLICCGNTSLISLSPLDCFGH